MQNQILDTVKNHKKLATAIGAGSLAAVYLSLRSARKAREAKGPRKRSTSIGTTRMMVAGTIPNPDNKYDCIINIRCEFHNKANGLPSKEAISSVFAKGVVPYTQFHSIPVQEVPGKDYHWVSQLPLSTEKHFLEEHIAASNVNARIDEIINTRLSTKDAGLPWWEVRLLRDPATNSGTMLIRIHHALGDGVSLMEMFADSLEDEQGAKIDAARLFNTARGAASKVRKTGLQKMMTTLRNLIIAPFVVLDVVRSVVKVAAAAAVRSDTKNVFNNDTRLFPYQNNRFTVYFPSHSLALVKQFKQKTMDKLAANGKFTNITINDIEYALFSGAIRRYLMSYGEDTEGVLLRSLTPFAVMEEACPTSRLSTLLRNHWTFLMNAMPLAPESAVQRIVHSHNSWSSVKNSTIVPVSFFLHKLTGSIMNHAAQLETNVQLATRHAVVFSNVPGPQHPIYFGGSELTSCHMLFPNVGHQVGMLSINGWVHMCMVMTSDKEKEEVQRRLAQFFKEEVEEAAAELGIDKADVAAGLKVVV